MIGISCSLLTKKMPKMITAERYHVSAAYVQAVSNAGEISCLLPILTPDKAEEVVSQLDGIILSGGNDIHPDFYLNSTMKENAQARDTLRERDLYEMALCRAALKQKKPILGVCRGAQLLNVVLGGTLIQDIQQTTKIAHIQSEDPEVASHLVEIEEDSCLMKIVGQKKIGVNSYHHQVIDEVGVGLQVTAYSEDGFIEAIEYTGESFALGIQWHPEIMANKDLVATKIFKYFINEVHSLKKNSLLNSKMV
ncbi:gamma-glutamyl-gamma-aminobutyrate hydrolase family protein [Vagococcus entomophilus]|uniref:Uncharacterized protein n=1 Tax=Vagococcus entomophilus TaxID=1160095 RepID=A0A430AJD1_9ENTE|nr:gamma-glutamyl-gamma-aminobutyrate hydrolase family protein [Vagococcus entomophilus]RSU08027.1 hypothetical protein CBF30_01945 [Vagococcus entomophilus]